MESEKQPEAKRPLVNIEMDLFGMMFLIIVLCCVGEPDLLDALIYALTGGALQ